MQSAKWPFFGSNHSRTKQVFILQVIKCDRCDYFSELILFLPSDGSDLPVIASSIVHKQLASLIISLRALLPFSCSNDEETRSYESFSYI
jgi:hypothetical protein